LSTTATVLIVRNVESVYYFYSNPVLSYLRFVLPCCRFSSGFITRLPSMARPQVVVRGVVLQVWGCERFERQGVVFQLWGWSSGYNSSPWNVQHNVSIIQTLTFRHCASFI